MSITNKDKYRQLCQEKSIPLFMQAWWMDAVCPSKEQWDVLLVEEEGQINGVLVYLLVTRMGFRLIRQPKFTQYNGIWLNYATETESYKKYAFEEKTINILVDQLSDLKIDCFKQNFHHSFSNWQPLYWKGFSQVTRYSYVINDISNLEEVFSHFHYFKQRHINKAKKKYSVDFELSVDDLYEFHKHTYEVKGEKLLYKKESLVRLYNATISRNQGKIIAIKDGSKILSAMFTVWDECAGYYILSAIDPKFKSSGASMLMVWEAIQFLSTRTKSFDFEGSMIKGVAKADQEFGGIQVPFFQITKNYSKMALLLLKGKRLFKRI